MEENNKIIAEFMGASIFEKDGYFKVINWSNPKDNSNKIVQSTPITMWGTKEETYLNVLNGLTNESYGRWSRFNSDWNWLMEVVERIENTKIKDYSISTNITNDKTYISLWHYGEGGKWSILISNYNEEYKDFNKIQKTYKAVIEFINFYNKQKEE